MLERHGNARGRKSIRATNGSEAYPLRGPELHTKHLQSFLSSPSTCISLQINTGSMALAQVSKRYLMLCTEGGSCTSSLHLLFCLFQPPRTCTQNQQTSHCTCTSPAAWPQAMRQAAEPCCLTPSGPAPPRSLALGFQGGCHGKTRGLGFRVNRGCYCKSYLSPHPPPPPPARANPAQTISPFDTHCAPCSPSKLNPLTSLHPSHELCSVGYGWVCKVCAGPGSRKPPKALHDPGAFWDAWVAVDAEKDP